MHRRLFHLLLFLLPHAATFSSAAAAGGGGCNRRCGATVVPYPFGFSGDCPIPLTCNATTSTALLQHSNASASSYPILSFNSSTFTFLASVAPSCDRDVTDAEASLTGAGYGITYRTSLFLRGGGGAQCRAPATGFNCTAPPALMKGLIRTPQCHNDTALTCVAAAAPNIAARGQAQFMKWEMVTKSGCKDLLSTALYEDTQQGPSVQFGVAELGWWLDGACSSGATRQQCAPNATCHNVTTPTTNTTGHRCVCRDGMNGDGFAAGDGCHNYASKKKSIHLVVAGVLVGVAAVTGVLLLCRLQRRRSASRRYGSAMRLLSEAASSSGVPVYSYHEVARATDGFSHTQRLGTGAYGTVYVGKLLPEPAPPVAIKRLRYRHEEDDAAAVLLLINEIKLVSSVSHPNLVRLLGCCLDRGEQILVYEYVPNGTLSHHLHHGDGRHRLSWRARLGVAAETASAIAYLHGTRPPIFHRDVKSGNILLDDDLRPKLADFGLSRAVAVDSSTRSHVSTAPQGTPGYVDPEYHQNFRLSDKSDVYSFGVVLLELVTAMKVVDFDRPAGEVNLASLALDRIGKGRVGEIVDPALVGNEEEWVAESVRRVSELAFRCLAFQKDVRPPMSEVADELGRIRAAAPPAGSDSRSGLGLQIDVSIDGADSVVKRAAASPVSVHEAWVSDRSSPSTNSSVVMPRFL